MGADWTVSGNELDRKWEVVVGTRLPFQRKISAHCEPPEVLLLASVLTTICSAQNAEKCVENELTREDSRVELIYFTVLSRSPVLTDLPVSKDRAGWMGVGV